MWLPVPTNNVVILTPLYRTRPNLQLKKKEVISRLEVNSVKRVSFTPEACLSSDCETHFAFCVGEMK
jgi:hypothetical protein